MGCTLCVKACPTKPEKRALEMTSIESQQDQQAVFDYAVKNVTEKPELINTTIKGSQFKQPLLEFSGACAGCAETVYARLITQLFGERMYIANATGCSSIWGGQAPGFPYTVNKQSGRGPAWANSLFEDNAEFGLGIALGQKVIRERLISLVRKLSESYAKLEGAAEVKAVVDRYLETVNDGAANAEAAGALVEMLKKNICKTDCNCCETERKILEGADYLAKKSIWIFGGDGWAYDIGFGGLDHVLARAIT